MPKLKCQINFKTQIAKNSWNLDFNIHLTFACLREAASAKAGILTFGILFAASSYILSSNTSSELRISFSKSTMATVRMGR
jgi:hypothetical protein